MENQFREFKDILINFHLACFSVQKSFFLSFNRFVHRRLNIYYSNINIYLLEKEGKK